MGSMPATAVSLCALKLMQLITSWDKNGPKAKVGPEKVANMLNLGWNKRLILTFFLHHVKTLHYIER